MPSLSQTVDKMEDELDALLGDDCFAATARIGMHPVQTLGRRNSPMMEASQQEMNELVRPEDTGNTAPSRTTRQPRHYLLHNCNTPQALTVRRFQTASLDTN